MRSIPPGVRLWAILLGCLMLEPARGQLPVRRDGDGNPLPAGAIARLGTLALRGCGDPILYTPGGKYFIATAGPSRSQVVFFDPDSGRRLFELGTSGTGTHMRVSPDGKRLACPVPGSYHNPVWDIESRSQLFTFEGSQAGFSADGSRLITVSFYRKGHCRILDSTTGQVLEDHFLDAELAWAEVVPERSAVVYYDKTTRRAMLFDWPRKSRRQVFAGEPGFGASASPDGKLLAIAHRQGVRLLDLDTGRELASWKQRADGVAVFAPDGRHLAWSGYDEQRGIAYPWVVEIGDGRLRRAGLPTNNFAPPCFTPDGKGLVVLEDGGIPVWRDLATGRELKRRQTHTGRVVEVLPTADGRHLLSRDLNRWLVWDVRAARLEKCYPDELPAGETVLPRATRFGHVLTLEEATSTLRLRDGATGREVFKLEGKHGFVGAPVQPMAVSADGKTAAFVSADYQIRLYNLDDGGLRFTHHPKAAVWSIDLSEDGRYLTWQTQSRLGNDGPFLLDTHPGKKPDGAKLARSRTGGRWTFFGQEDGLALVGILLDKVSKASPPSWPASIFDIVTSPDNQYLALLYGEAAAGYKGEVRLGVWDLTIGKPLGHLQPRPGRFCFAPNSRLFITTTFEGELDVWEVATGQKRISFKGHLAGEIPAMAFLDGGRTLISGGNDGQVMLWDLTGRARDGTWQTVRHDAARLKEMWAALAANDAVQAHRAIWDLSADPAGAVALLGQHLQPVPDPGAKLVAELIANLDAPLFATRQRASVELAKWGEAVLPAVRAAVKNPASLEQARRLQPLLTELERPDLTGDRLRGVRAVEVLENIGTDEARTVLARLAAGFAGARLTREAKRALKH